jgi:hypothetical protein
MATTLIEIEIRYKKFKAKNNIKHENNKKQHKTCTLNVRRDFSLLIHFIFPTKTKWNEPINGLLGISRYNRCETWEFNQSVNGRGCETISMFVFLLFLRTFIPISNKYQ